MSRTFSPRPICLDESQVKQSGPSPGLRPPPRSGASPRTTMSPHSRASTPPTSSPLSMRPVVLRRTSSPLSRPSPRTSTLAFSPSRTRTTRTRTWRRSGATSRSFRPPNGSGTSSPSQLSTHRTSPGRRCPRRLRTTCSRRNGSMMPSAGGARTILGTCRRSSPGSLTSVTMACSTLAGCFSP